MFTIEKDIVLREGEAIGTFKDGIVTLTVTLAPAHKSKLKKDLGEQGVEVTGFAKAEGVEEESNIPPMPAINPLQGDKTPAVVEWYRDHKPEEYKTRYAGRKTHLGTI